MKRERGRGRIFARGGKWWVAFYVRGTEHREPTGVPVDGPKVPKAAEGYLNRRLKEVGADEIGARPFLTHKQEKITVGELLDALEADYKVREKLSPPVVSHIKRVRDEF